MHRVYVAESLVDGQLILDLLAENQIPARLFNQHSQGALGELPVTHPEVWVTRECDIERATTLIARRDATIGAINPLTCPRCGETNPGNFEICWLCHRALEISGN